MVSALLEDYPAGPSRTAFDVSTLEQRLADSVAPERLYAVILAVFAQLALLLAVVGVYGLLSFTVTQKTRETGIRIALGAQRSQVLSHTLWQGLRLSGLGVALGLVGAWLASGVLRGMLFGIEPNDPLTFAVLGATLLLAGVLASYLPARRAARADPVAALRHE